MERVFKFKVTQQYDGENIKTVLKQRFKMSTALIKALKKYESGIRVNGEHRRVIDKVRMDDIITVTLKDTVSETIKPVNIPLDVVYEDEDILVINKQPGLPTHPSMGNYEKSAANAVMYYYAQKGEERTFRAVNRLDKDTSGLMAIAKNAYIHARLVDEIHSGGLKRKYMCIVCGDVESGGTVDAPIRRGEDSVINRIVAEDGHRAVTHYNVIKRYGKYTMLEMELETGRTHQIRVHMAHIGHPLAGDWLYGTEDKTLVPRQMLHSYYLKLLHPVEKKEMEFKIGLADDMIKFVEKVSQNS